MSRTRHKLQSEDWYGQWAGYFHRENRDMRQRGREKRRKIDERVATCPCEGDYCTNPTCDWPE